MTKNELYAITQHTRKNYEFAFTDKKCLLFRAIGEATWQEISKLPLSLIKDSSQDSSDLPMINAKDAREAKEYIGNLIECNQIPLVRDDIRAGIRVIAKNENTYVDHGTCVVKISKTGVKEVNPPDSISLQKTTQQLPLPPLVPEGNLMALAELLKVPMKSFYQILMFLVSILIGCPRVILVITGCPGSGKSTLAALAKALLDPENSSLTSLPGKLSDLKLMVSKSRVLVLDNITNFDNRFADTLCMVVTGGSTKQRTLYTTDDTTVNEFTSSIIMTALHKPTERADLIERMIFVECPKLKEPISEKELHAKFEEAKPAILRGLYDLVHEGYKNEDYKPVKTANRMQDLIHFMGRLEKTLGQEYGFFAKFSDELNKELKEDIAENSILAITLAKVLKNAAASSDSPHEFRLKKKNSEILNLLHSYAPKNAFKDPEFPKTSASLGRKLSELSTVLKTLGIAFERQNSTKDGGRTIEFYFTNKQKKRMLKRQETQPKKSHH